MVLSTSQLRQAWAPACENAHGAEIVAMWEAIDDVMLHHRYVPRPGVTSAANCRPITGGSGHSIHSFYDRGRRYTFRSSAPGKPVTIAVAAALDVNSDTNPYGPRLVTDMPEAMWRDWLRVRTNNGRQLLVWGGLFSPNHDAMHVQPGCSPADIRTGIDRSTLPTTAPTPTPPEEPDMDAADKARAERIETLLERMSPGLSSYGDDGPLNDYRIMDDGRVVQLVGGAMHRDFHTIAVPGSMTDETYTDTVKGPRTRTDFTVELVSPKGTVRWFTYDPARAGFPGVGDLPADRHLVPDGGGYHYVDIAT